MTPKNFNGVIGKLESKRQNYNAIAIGDIRNVSMEEWAEHWRPHGPGWRNPSPDNIQYLERAYGGSDMAALMGVSHFKTRLELFNEKVGITPALAKADNYSLGRGHDFESAIALSYHRFRRDNKQNVKLFIEGKKILPDGTVADGDYPISMQIYRDGRMDENKKLVYPWALANCDGFLVEDGVEGILEIKSTTPQNYKVIDDWKAGIMPEGYFWQIVYYMAILNVQFADICCRWDMSQNGFAVIRLYRDYDAEQKLFAAIAEFDEYVEQCVEPDASFDNPELLNQYYHRLWGSADKSAPMIELPESFRSVINQAISIEEEIQKAKEALAKAEEKREMIYNTLYPVFKNSAYGQFKLSDTEVCGITLKTPMKRAKFDEEKFKTDYPSLYQECMEFSATKLNEIDKRLKKEYTLDPEPNTDPDKKPGFELKIKTLK